MKENRNPLTKAAILEIVQLFDNVEKATKLRELVYLVCNEDIQTTGSIVGWQLYLEQATSIVLNNGNLTFLLQNENEEVVIKTLKWMNRTGISGDPKLLYKLACQDKWEGVCALALQAMSKENSEFTLEECICAFEKSGVMPVTEGWITLAGYVAKTVYHFQF